MVSAQATGEGGQLRERRRGAGITQQQLAERAHCSIAIVRLLEGGYQPARSHVLPRILAVLENDASPAGKPGSVTTSAGRGRDEQAE
jgi:transcriptional regulator with XRE-family HTH domain